MDLNSFKNQNVLVTGGAGFVGSHLVEALIEYGAHVYVVDNNTHPSSYFSLKNLDKKAEVFNHDVCDFEEMLRLILRYDIGFIFHLAAQALVEKAYDHPRMTLMTNIQGTVNVLECARLCNKVKAVVIASSDKAYGKLETGDKYIEAQALRGDHPYEVSKSSADLIAYSYYKTYGLPVVITRFGNIYGEGDLNFSRIVPGIMKSLIRGETLALRSDGSHVRDYLYVKDVVEGYLRLAIDIDNRKGEAYNFGSEDTYTVFDLIKLTEKHLNKKLDYEVVNNARNENKFQSLDYSKIKKSLKWQPAYSLHQVLPAIYKWYENYFSLKTDRKDEEVRQSEFV